MPVLKMLSTCSSHANHTAGDLNGRLKEKGMGMKIARVGKKGYFKYKSTDKFEVRKRRVYSPQLVSYKQTRNYLV